MTQQLPDHCVIRIHCEDKIEELFCYHCVFVSLDKNLSTNSSSFYSNLTWVIKKCWTVMSALKVWPKICFGLSGGEEETTKMEKHDVFPHISLTMVSLCQQTAQTLVSSLPDLQTKELSENEVSTKKVLWFQYQVWARSLISYLKYLIIVVVNMSQPLTRYPLRCW